MNLLEFIRFKKTKQIAFDEYFFNISLNSCELPKFYFYSYSYVIVKSDFPRGNIYLQNGRHEL